MGLGMAGAGGWGGPDPCAAPCGVAGVPDQAAGGPGAGRDAGVEGWTGVVTMPVPIVRYGAEAEGMLAAGSGCEARGGRWAALIGAPLDAGDPALCIITPPGLASATPNTSARAREACVAVW